MATFADKFVCVFTSSVGKCGAEMPRAAEQSGLRYTPAKRQTQRWRVRARRRASCACRCQALFEHPASAGARVVKSAGSREITAQTRRKKQR